VFVAALPTISTREVGLLIAGLVLGAGSLVAGVVTQLGPPMRMKQTIVRQYRFAGDRFRRNATFALIPAGTWFLVGALAFSPWAPPAVTDVGAVVFGVGLLTGLWFMWRLPDWAVPRWYREEEAAGFPCLAAKIPRGRFTLLRSLVVMTAVFGGCAWFLWSQNLGPGALAVTLLYGLGALFAIRAQQRNAHAAKQAGSAAGQSPARQSKG
jgi:hypothetical protein